WNISFLANKPFANLLNFFVSFHIRNGAFLTGLAIVITVCALTKLVSKSPAKSTSHHSESPATSKAARLSSISPRSFCNNSKSFRIAFFNLALLISDNLGFCSGNALYNNSKYHPRPPEFLPFLFGDIILRLVASKITLDTFLD
ncbi:30221_t:CDS:2, partial [Racocetra persica]